jgi:HEAT repeat protein
MLQSVQPVLLAGIMASFSWDAATAQVAGRSDAKTPQDRVERVLKAIASGEKIEGDTSPMVPDLIAVVENGEREESNLAIRALAAMKSKARPAAVAISKKLGDPDHATRSAAADALVAIGDGAVVPLRKLLSLSTARTRASATQALVRLKRLDVVDVDRLSNDPDPRVRAALADALSSLGKRGVSRLADMLVDPELAVAVEAARALKSNREGTSIAIPKLIRALSREHLSSAAGDALSVYGVAAQRAVPALVKAHQEEALQHIGPPSELDIPQLCEDLAHGDVESRILTAKWLALLGLNARSASVALEAAAEKSINEYVRQKRNPKPHSPLQFDDSGRVLLAGEDCAAAFWTVTHDIPRFLNLIERLAIAADEPLSCSDLTGLPDISADHCRLIEVMLRRPNLKLKETALNVLSKAGPRVQQLKSALVEIAHHPNAELSQKAIGTLGVIGADAGREVEPILLSKRRDGSISLQQFADAVGRLGIRSEATRAILERGLHGLDPWTTGSCASAMCMTSNEPRRTARMIIDAARDGDVTDRLAISALNEAKLADDVVIPYLVAQLNSTDHWTRADAIDSIGGFGARASQAITPLKKLLDDESGLIRLKAAKAIFLIANNPADLDRQLELVFAQDDPADRRDALETIAELKHSGGRFVRYALTELRRSTPDDAETAIKALGAIGTEEAVEALRATAGSSDWMLRSQATEALRRIRNPNEKRIP